MVGSVTRLFGSMRIVRVVCLMSLPLVVTACTQFGEITSGNPTVAQPSAAPPPMGAGIPPELRNIFTNAPYESSQPLAKQYPHVAFTVLSSPPNHSQTLGAQVPNGGQAAADCWVLSAIIWYKEVTSRAIDPFTVCMPAILSGTQSAALSGYDNWALAGQEMSNVRPEDQSTGISRTNGPIPPDTPFPTGARYATYYGQTGGANGGYPGGTSEEGRMWAAVLYKMGLIWRNTSDRRVWVYKYVSVEG
jgi:hypothetical protein